MLYIYKRIFIYTQCVYILYIGHIWYTIEIPVLVQFIKPCPWFPWQLSWHLFPAGQHMSWQLGVDGFGVAFRPKPSNRSSFILVGL